MLIKNEKKPVFIVKKKDFRSLRTKGKRIEKRCFFVVYKRNSLSYSRFSLFFPGWTGKAVQRNRFKRWARHFIRKRPWPAGLDILLGFEKTEKDFYNNVNYKEFYTGFEKVCQNIEL